jgi:hypothetical protein
MGRNPHVPISKEPLTREAVQHLRNFLSTMWEDTRIGTMPHSRPDGIYIMQLGNLQALCDHLLTDTPLAQKAGGETIQQQRLLVRG